MKLCRVEHLIVYKIEGLLCDEFPDFLSIGRHVVAGDSDRLSSAKRLDQGVNRYVWERLRVWDKVNLDT